MTRTRFGLLLLALPVLATAACGGWWRPSIDRPEDVPPGACVVPGHKPVDPPVEWRRVAKDTVEVRLTCRGKAPGAAR